MDNKKVVRTTIGNINLSIETGKVARQAGGSVWVQYGETIVLATAVGKEKVSADQDFFPLTVDYTEKMYAAGRIPGNFFKREGRPSTEQILISRMIDRPLRPLFPEGFMNEVSVSVNVLSYDGIHHPEAIATLAASAALSISPIPFMGPVASVIVGFVDGKFVVNPTPEELEKSKLKLSLAGTKQAITMVEAGADMLTEDEMLEALQVGHDAIIPLCKLQEDLVVVAGKPKWEVELKLPDQTLEKELVGEFSEKMRAAFKVAGKLEKYKAMDEVKAGLVEYVQKKYGEDFAKEKSFDVNAIFSKIESLEFRKLIVKEKLRTDNRKMTEIRPISCEVNVLPRAHGSALFTRGETQSLGAVTLGAGKDEVLVDGLDESYKKKFYLHYNFPSFSVNEVGGRPGPGRREIGHGALAERALSYIMPKDEDFPYVVRIVSDILESNGSSSMASVCSGCLSLMQAGVPIKEPVAGIAMGLILNEDGFEVLTDIAGLEDHLGDMDFKVAGGKNGITALQMDIKINGISFEILKKALAQAKEARLQILDKMTAVISNVNDQLSAYAPRIVSLKVDPEKVGEIIGPGGKNIKRIIEECSVDIDIEDNGIVKIFSDNKEGLDKAKAAILGIVQVPEVGMKALGTIKKVTSFGVFVEFLPGKEGLVHVSKLGDGFIKNVEDHYSVGEKMEIIIDNIDSRGRINLIKA